MNTPEQKYPAKVQLALRHLDAAGVPRRQSAPLLHRVLWRSGVTVAPPMLASMTANTLLMGVWFAFAWGLLMWLLLWRGSTLSSAMAVFAALVAGAGFGLLMAALMRGLRLRHRLPLWRDLPDTPPA
ncbi:DUF6404 family protein [Stenotrophomonas sp. 24(2023)]|uniref:DUF6404 family protein n=1 Tax=Stenotrophomonas sp. 24(2023) TaxID=3068324 RepID=UPI0027DF35FB|nr:DUF6404 family protein [Stenotrophomonas sp. 24(2023)]WMJ68381.1 DUF6404 family protein [Stenotrophomonas sp. 24(2023)]